MNFFSQLIERLKSDTPIFFKTIIKFSISLGVIGAGFIAIPESVVFVLPFSIHAIGGYFIAIGSVAAVVAKTTVDDTKQQ